MHRDMVVDTVNRLYSEHRNGEYFLIPNASEKKVRRDIYNELSKLTRKTKLIDLYIFTSQIENSVMIKI